MAPNTKLIVLYDMPDEAQEKVATLLRGEFDVASIRTPPSDLGDLLIFDFVSCGFRGLDFCTKLKRNPRTENLPVIFLTNGDPDMALAAFRAGADDCVPWAVSAQELKVRVVARLRGSKSRNARMSFCRGRVELDAVKQSVFFSERDGAERSVEVTPHEFRLFHYLIERESKIVGRQELMEAAWNRGVNVLPRTIDKHISSLREKVRSICRIESVRQNGYVLSLAPSVDD